MDSLESEDRLPKAISMAPLGSLPEFDKDEQEIFRRLSLVEHMSLEQFPELAATFTTVANAYTHIRNELGLDMVEFKQKSVHLISSVNYAQLEFDIPQIENPVGFYDVFTNICYLEFNPTLFESSQLEKVRSLYSLTHELAHKAAKGGAGNFHLREGVAEDYTRFLMRDVRAIVTPLDKGYTQEHFEESLYEFRGLEVREEDVVYISENGAVLVYYYFPEMRLVERLKSQNPDAYTGLLQLIFDAKYYEIHPYLYDNYGTEVADLLGSESNADFETIAAKLSI